MKQPQRNDTVTFRYRDPAGTVRTWSVGCAPADTDATLRAHFDRWRPECELLDWSRLGEPQEATL